MGVTTFADSQIQNNGGLDWGGTMDLAKKNVVGFSIYFIGLVLWVGFERKEQ